MAFNEKLPEWNNIGAEPPQAKKDAGWLVQEKPPASFFNWLFNRIFKCIEEIRTIFAAHESNTSHITGDERTSWNAKETTVGAQAKVDTHTNAADPHPQYALDTELDSHKNENATTLLKGHVQLGTTAGKAAEGNHTHAGVYEPADPDIMKKDVAVTMTANLIAPAETDYSTKRVRNIYAGTADMTAGVTALDSGVIYVVYE